MIANIIAGLALLVSIGALVISWVYGARSAQAAKDSANEAKKVRQAELEREHRDYTPVLNDLSFPWERNPRDGENIQFLNFTLPKTYRVFGNLIHDTGGRSPLGNGLGGALEAGTPQYIYVSGSSNQSEAVELRFFPPVSGDPGEAWSCPCDRDSTPDGDKTGHWVVRLQVPSRQSSRVTVM